MKRVIILVALVAGLLAIPTLGLASDQAGEPGGELVISTGGYFTVKILPRSALFTNNIYLDEPGPAQFIDTASNLGSITGPFGPFAAGTELVFRIDVNPPLGPSYFTGPGSGNPDGFEHAIVTTNGPGDWTVAFEDLPGLGDHDFFDAVFRVVFVSCDPETSNDCTTEDGNGSEAEVECDDCSPIVVTPETATGGDTAQFNVNTLANSKGTTFEMVVTMGSRSLSTPPGKAEVEMDPDTGSSFIMPKCKKSNDTDCVVQIKRVKGGLTQYTLRFDSDPRFRFR